jgi:hypothetical protein
MTPWTPSVECLWAIDATTHHRAYQEDASPAKNALEGPLSARPSSGFERPYAAITGPVSPRDVAERPFPSEQQSWYRLPRSG